MTSGRVRAVSSPESDEVSVALATYNGGRFIDEQLRSFAQQSRLPSEVVICDDGSTDDTLERIDQFARTAPFPVRVSRNPRRLGFSDNFFNTISQCRSEVVALSDQDDVWQPGKLETCMTVLKRDASVLAVHAARIVDANLSPLGELKLLADQRRLILPLRIRPVPGMGFGMTFVFRRQLTTLIDPGSRPPSVTNPQLKVAHDEWILLLASIFGSISTIPENLVWYRQHGDNAFGTSQSSPWERAKYALELSAQRHTRRLAHSEATAEALERNARGLPEPYRARALEGAVYYRRIADYFARRLKLYQAASHRARVAHLIGLVARDAYSPRGLGPRALVKDAVYSLWPLPRSRHAVTEPPRDARTH